MDPNCLSDVSRCMSVRDFLPCEFGKVDLSGSPEVSVLFLLAYSSTLFNILSRRLISEKSRTCEDALSCCFDCYAGCGLYC